MIGPSANWVDPPVDETRRKERFRAVYETTYARILGYALRRATPEDAADLVAETYLVAWRRFDDVPPGDEALLWLYGIAHRVLANQRRGRQRRAALAERLAADLARSRPFVPEHPPDDLTQLARAWRRLQPTDRELLGLVVWEGLGAEQLCRVLGCSRAVLKVRLHRARRRFAAQLAREGVELDAGDRGRRAPLKPLAASGHERLERTHVRPDTEELP